MSERNYSTDSSAPARTPSRTPSHSSHDSDEGDCLYMYGCEMSRVRDLCARGGLQLALSSKDRFVICAAPTADSAPRVHYDLAVSSYEASLGRIPGSSHDTEEEVSESEDEKQVVHGEVPKDDRPHTENCLRAQRERIWCEYALAYNLVEDTEFVIKQARYGCTCHCAEDEERWYRAVCKYDEDGPDSRAIRAVGWERIYWEPFHNRTNRYH